MNSRTIGRAVRWARRRAGMTQGDLAQATGMPQPSIARIEAGAVVPRTATLIKILQATGHRLWVEPKDGDVDRDAIGRQLAMAPTRRTRAARDSAHPILRVLRRFGVPFVLIGELAERAHGSPSPIGRDVQLCTPSTDVARERLDRALLDLPAADRRRLRVVTETAAGDDYDVLRRNAVAMNVTAGLRVRVAALEDLIRARRAARTTKDAEEAATLAAVIEEGAPRPR
jgi:transcriptional regulator with XRE-family HTH domain